ncbi:MAG: ABC transporter permease [Eubacteriales bacterium]|nr:ABC transporter permease [Eubacteriales bacterium]
MKRRDFWKLSLMNVSSSPVRSCLTVMGMAIGIGAILAVLTLGDAGKTQVQSEMARLGIDRVWLTAEDGDRLSQGDAAFLADALHTTVTEQVYAPTTAAHGERQAECVLVGCSAEYLTVMDTEILKGRALYPLEWQADGKCVFLGKALAEELNASPGDLFTLNGLGFRCAGIVAQHNEMSQVDSTRAVFMPIAVFGRLVGQTVHEITLSVPPQTKPHSIATMAMDIMENRKSIRTKAVTMQVQIEAANSVMSIFVDVLKWVAVICILVGGIGVMNILLVSVRERKREIGVMKSLGAAPYQICFLFLLEAFLYAITGGVLGLVIGFGLIRLAGQSIGLHPQVLWTDCLTVFLAAMAVGLLFGVLPASRAAGLHPVDALRDE